MSKLQRSGAMVGAALWISAVATAQPRTSGPVASAASEAFGLETQVLGIGAAAFQHLNASSGFEIDWTTDGYLYYNDPAYLGVFVAPLTLPAGARIVQICTYFYDNVPGAAVSTSVDAVKLGGGSAAPGVVPVLGPFSTDFDGAYGYFCAATPAYTFLEFGDVDGDGVFEDLVHRVRVEMTENGVGAMGLGGVKVYWRRQVRPAPDAATFADVPINHDFFQFVEALAASGITAGCSGGNFCPDAPLTRGQMAVFLSKALGLHWPN